VVAQKKLKNCCHQEMEQDNNNLKKYTKEKFYSTVVKLINASESQFYCAKLNVDWCLFLFFVLFIFY